MFREPIPFRTTEVVTRDGFVYCDVVPSTTTDFRDVAPEGASGRAAASV
ncbi:MAG TPA: hypothetical protein VEN95_09770 [Actinomycetota bacterium]|nr:hypothetical protein [Actinomycetota bacterium]